jgi:hypothetical protein
MRIFGVKKVSKFRRMTKADLVKAIQAIEQLVSRTRKYSEDLQTGRAVTDRLNVEKLLESNAKAIEAKLAIIDADAFWQFTS